MLFHKSSSRVTADFIDSLKALHRITAQSFYYALLVLSGGIGGVYAVRYGIEERFRV